jgi:phosphatidate phosphatase APP1
MNHFLKPTLLFSCLLILAGFTSDTFLKDTESEDRRQITIYNTYGYLDGDEWVIPMRLWVHNPRRIVERLTTRVTRSIGDLSRREVNTFRSRLRDFAANSRSRRTVNLEFKQDPDGVRYRVEDLDGNHPRTDQNGIIRGTLRLPVDKAETLLENQESENGWLTIEASSGRYSGTGRIQLIEPEGVSVVSDIDDTVKITEIPAGARIVVRNTFFKEEYAAAPGMAEMYKEWKHEEWDDVTFHYVSGAPWQLFGPITDFLFSEEANFPEGTFHMKSVRKNVLALSSWRDLRELATNEKVTYDQKVTQISRLMQHFPDRQFILVGDSGEMDPEVYTSIEEMYSDQVKEIFIRDVVNHRELNPERLEGMTIIPAPTIERGVSQFDGYEVYVEAE